MSPVGTGRDDGCGCGGLARKGRPADPRFPHLFLIV